MKRKLFAAAAAILAVISSAAPAHAGGPVNEVLIIPGTATNPYGDYRSNAVSTGAISLAAGGTTLACSSATATGDLHSRQVSSAPYPQYLTFDNVNFAGCSGPLGLGMEVLQNCDLTVHADPGTQNVDAGLTDLAVTGYVDLGGSCLTFVDTATGTMCRFDLTGQTTATFDETRRTHAARDWQQLTISGSGLSIANPNCLGFFLGNPPATISLTLLVRVYQSGVAHAPLNNGSIDFRD